MPWNGQRRPSPHLQLQFLLNHAPCSPLNSRITMFVLKLIIIILLFSYTISTCAPGHIPPTPCHPCPPGTFVNSTSRLNCVPCPAGTYRPTSAAEHPDQCFPCPAGTYSSAGSIRCTTCPHGLDSRTGAPSCSRCGPGTRLRWFSNHYGRDGCQPCAAGTFSNKTSNRFCDECGDGTEARGTGWSACRACKRGMYAKARPPPLRTMDLMFIGTTIGCQDCPRGTYSNKRGAAFCNICPLGTVSTKGSGRCEACPRGTFSNRIRSGWCRPCPHGTTSVGARPAACRKLGGGCPWNTFVGKSGDCEACLPGERLDETTKTCVLCPPNAISKGGVETECKTCPLGMEPLPAGSKFARSDCRCKRGTVDDGNGRCVMCPAGTFWYPLQNTYEFPQPQLPELPESLQLPNTPLFPYCMQCPRGFFQPHQGSDYCLKCPQDHFSMSRGSVSCLKCPSGSVNPEEYGERLTTKCVSMETNCLAGFKREYFPGLPGKYERSYFCSPTQCTMPETFVDRATAQCVSCQPGLRYDSLRKRCVTCNSKFSELGMGGTSTICRKCPRNSENRVSFHEDNFRCQCKEGYGLLRRTCIPCPPGTESRRTADGVRRCVVCRPGTFTNKPRQKCKRCDKHEVTEGWGARRCVKCPGKCRMDISVTRVSLNRCVPGNAYCENDQWLDKLSRGNAEFVY